MRRNVYFFIPTIYVAQLFNRYMAATKLLIMFIPMTKYLQTRAHILSLSLSLIYLISFSLSL